MGTLINLTIIYIRDASLDSLQPEEKRVKFSNLEEGGKCDAENQQLEAAHDDITPDLHGTGTCNTATCT